MCASDSSWDRDGCRTQLRRRDTGPCALMKAKHSCAYMTEACEIHCGKLIKSLSRNAPTLHKSGGGARCVAVARRDFTTFTQHALIEHF